MILESRDDGEFKIKSEGREWEGEVRSVVHSSLFQVACTFADDGPRDEWSRRFPTFVAVTGIN